MTRTSGVQLVCAGFLSAGVLVSAQVAAEESSGAVLEEVVVTATKRTERLLDVPQSVSVVDGAALDRQQATSFQDYLKLVPGLQLTQDTPGVGRLILRGINTGGVASTVAVYVDETPFGSSTGLVNGAILAGDFDTFDLQRIEVLRGPQGTLYGASSLGGVLKFVTNDPQTDHFAARVRASVENVSGADGGYSGNGMINVPLSDTFAFRASGYYHQLGGFIDSIGTGGSDVASNINGSKTHGGRLAALWRPNETFSLRLSAVLQDIDTQGSSTVESDPDTLKTLYSRDTQSRYVPEFTDVKYRVYNATMDINFNFGTLTSSTSYNEFSSPFRSDLTFQFSPLIQFFFGVPNEFLQEQTTGYDKVTQELRLASHTNDRFDWLAGGYYTHEKGEILQHLEAVVPGTLNPIALPTLGDLSLDSKYTEYAGFVSGTFHFGNRFDLTLGGRYSNNDQEATQHAVGVFAGGDVSYPIAKSSEDVFTYSLAPKLKFGEHAALYARIASGFRPGGPNVLPPGAPANVPLTYDSDTLTSYELGYKMESSDRVYSLDVAAFHIDWKDIQLFAQVANFGVNVNGGGAKSDGFEFVAAAHPVTGFTVSLNGAYTNAKLKDDTDPLVGGLKDDRLPYTPEWSLGANADYQWPIGGQATAYVGGSLRYLSDQTASYDIAFRTANGRQREIPSYEVLDLQTGIDFGQVSVGLYMKNLTDSDGKTSAGTPGAWPNGAIGTGVIRPRTVGLTFDFSF